MDVNSLSESLPSLLAATVAFAIGTSVVLRDRSRDEFVLFGVFCFNLGLFHLARFFHGLVDEALFGWAAQSISLVLPWTADRCFSSLIPSEGPLRRSKLRTFMLVVLLSAHAVALFVLLGRGDRGLEDDGPFQWITIGLNTYVIVGLLLVILRIWRAARSARGTAVAPRMRYLLYASLCGLVLGSPILPSIGPVVTAVYLYFVAQTVVRERLMELPEVISRTATLTLMVVSVTALFAVLLLWIPINAGGNTSLFLFIIAVGSYAVIVLIDPVRAEFESRIETWLFRDRVALRSLLVDLRRRLANVIEPEAMVQVMIDALRDSKRVTRASVYLLDSHGKNLVLGGELGGASPMRLDVARRRPLLERMRSRGAQLRDVIQREQERGGRDADPELTEILDTLGELGASLAVPILTQANPDDRDAPAELVGALFVDDERLLEPFSREEVELFEGLAAQAGITLQNSAVYEVRKEVERLALLGEMAAGLAHEIRNPLGAIKGAVQVVEPKISETDPHTGEFLLVIVEEVERLNRVVTQFLNYSRPFKGEMEPVDMGRVVQATLRVLDPERLERVRVQIGGDSTPLPAIRGDAEALRQVVHNLVLNALDATEAQSVADEPCCVWIDSHIRSRGLPGCDALVVTVHDDGPGLTSHTMTNLFVPFHTTKSGGTGLGLPISQRIVENHRGSIEVANRPEGGAIFSIVLPIIPSTAASSSGAAHKQNSLEGNQP